jgi:hypothetical protein
MTSPLQDRHGYAKSERMPTDAEQPNAPAVDAGEPRPPRQGSLSPEAERALAEAAARRANGLAKTAEPKEIGGRDGPDPARYGDWEINGLASDF